MESGKQKHQIDDDDNEDGREKRCRNNGQRRRIIFQRYRRGEQVQRD